MEFSFTTPIHSEQRLKAFLYGPAGCGKTLAALQFPNAAIVDTAKETDRYWKLIQQKNSKSFKCSNPFRVIKEVQKLKDNPHNFTTLVIDEATTLYSNLQQHWNDRFIYALETKKAKNKSTKQDENLLYDFGPRFWDKVKRDWKIFIDLLLQLDMNVIVNAHQKNEYGEDMKVIGKTSASDSQDEYIFDFVFRLIRRGSDYKAVTEKQRILPVEIDPDAKRFPKEFEWKYDNLLKFYNKDYIEKPPGATPTKTTPTTNTPPPEKSKPPAKDKPPWEEPQKLPPEIKTEITTSDPVPPSKTETTKTGNNIDKIKALLKQEGITTRDFKTFLQNECKWGGINVLSKLSTKQQNLLLDNWTTRILPKYKDTTETTKVPPSKKTPKPETTPPKTETLKTEEPAVGTTKNPPITDKNAPITEAQKAVILKTLKDAGKTVEDFFEGFTIVRWEEVTQSSAFNMIKNLDVMIGAI